MKELIGTVLFYILFCSTLVAQTSSGCDPKRFDDALLDKLVGKWDLAGQIGKRNVKNDFSAEWSLNHQFVELSFVDASNPPAYTARVFIGYDCVSERYVVHWLDSFGARFSETLGYGKRSGQEIEFRFEYADGPFLNKFTYDPKSDEWHFHLTRKDDKGQWVVFADQYLRRKK